MKFVYYVLVVDILSAGCVLVTPFIVITAMILVNFIYLQLTRRLTHPTKPNSQKRKDRVRKIIIQFQIQFAKTFFGDWVIDSEKRGGKTVILLLKNPSHSGHC